MSKTGPTADRHQNDPATWIDVYGDYLYSYAYYRTRDQSSAEYLVQETLLAALRAKDTFESRSSVKTWLTGILKHKIITFSPLSCFFKSFLSDMYFIRTIFL